MKSTLLGITVNLGLSITKISAGMVGHSFALVADGLESGADVLSGFVVFFGLKIAVKPPDMDHPYPRGHCRPDCSVDLATEQLQDERLRFSTHPRARNISALSACGAIHSYWCDLGLSPPFHPHSR
jgi:hypothetical protein